MTFDGIYIGMVENVADPERLGRIKVRVPAAYGIIGSANGAIPVDDLPWALPLGLPAGQSQRSGGMDWLPVVGDQVAVQFIDSEAEKPVWSWLMQTMDSATGFRLHQYDESTGRVAAPKRGALTRYGHTVEWNDGGIIATTSAGYRLFLVDESEFGSADGSATLSTELGQFLELDDSTSGGLLNVLEDFYMQIGHELSINAGSVRLDSVDDIDVVAGGGVSADITGDFDLTCLGVGTVSVTDDLMLSSDLRITLDFGTQLMLGIDSTEPFVLGNQLVAFLESLLEYVATHTHVSASPGAPTTPPIIPPETVVQPPTAELVSETIFGQ